jgi:hypothetical protein
VDKELEVRRTAVKVGGRYIIVTIVNIMTYLPIVDDFDVSSTEVAVNTWIQ